QVEKWNILDDKMLEQEFAFKNFKEALKFVNACGEIAEADGHHPNLFLHSWNKVKVTLYTHAIDGLSINDFVVAAKIDKIKI
ncbi:MAG: 4a-hydroxytetrahydrobiopterin dehydratase, partial [candidate division Zixibacteria bacterium]|nr:4a-hydroxytetrahydrobiopterin dehydratase [candidate division Zixibacteria bacterium]